MAHTTPLLAVYAACSEGDTANIELCERYGVTFCVVPNSPLGAKWNAAMALVPDGEDVMVLGSDDFVSQEWIEASKGHQYATPSACALYDLETGRACVLRKNGHGAQYFGAGRVYSADVVMMCRPFWTDSAERALDSDAHARVSALGVDRKTIITARVPIVDVKTKENLWAYARWEWAGKAATADDVLWMLSAEVRTHLCDGLA